MKKGTNPVYGYRKFLFLISYVNDVEMFGIMAGNSLLLNVLLVHGNWLIVC